MKRKVLKQNLIISFSGGKTSGYMTKLILDNWKHLYNIIVIFANTGQEHEETLKFVNNCDKYFNFNTIWVEAVINDKNKGTTFKIVDFKTASRKGEPFEAMIKKYGIPNICYPHCTRELKLAPINSYIKFLNWTHYKIAIGIRIDEDRRISKKAKINNIIYPLITTWESDIEDINIFWEDQIFTLNIEQYQGNCIWCWKKTDSKHFKLIKENNKIYNFPARMELMYGLNGNGNDLKDLGPRTFFRNYRSTIDMRKEAGLVTKVQLKHMVDNSMITRCTESCEVFL